VDVKAGTVAFARQGVAIDLGGIGKGYAVDVAVGTLRRLGVSAGLLHAGTSSIYALGSPPDRPEWLVGVSHPTDQERRLATLALKDRAVSVSSNVEQAFEHAGQQYGHVLDPRTGRPVSGVLCAAVVADAAALADALSTAFLVLGEDGTRDYCRRHREIRALILPEGEPTPLEWPDYERGARSIRPCR
jgi:thiamine biosynthesis lipoprotein